MSDRELSSRIRKELYELLLSPTFQHELAEVLWQDNLKPTLERQLTATPPPEQTTEAPDHLYIGGSFYGQALRCPRKAWYKARNYDKGILLPHAKLKFMYGDMTEFLLLKLLKSTSLCVENVQRNTAVNLTPTMTVRGPMDCTINGLVFDIKSASSFAFKKFKELQDGSIDSSLFLAQDSFGYLDQLCVYNEGSVREGVAGWVAFDKTLGHIATPTTGIVGRSEFIFHEGTVTTLEREIRKTNPPLRNLEHSPVPEGKSGNKKLCVSCSYCDYKKECWKDANGGKGVRTFLYSNRPIDLVEVVKLPKVPEIDSL